MVDGPTTHKRPERFYTDVTVSEGPAGWTILLDGRAARTAARAALAAPTRALADVVAAEWRAVDGVIDMRAMISTRLLAAAIDQGETQRRAWMSVVTTFLQTDLLCYRAPSPAALAARQAREWNPLLDWFAVAYGLRLATVEGVMKIDQTPQLEGRVRSYLASASSYALLAVKSAAEMAGSAVIALRLGAAPERADALFSSAVLDELFQEERWGVDAEAGLRREALRKEFMAVGDFLIRLGERTPG